MLDEIRDAKPGTTLWDKGEKGSIKGLHVRTFADGSKDFYLYYRTRSGQQRKPKIGTFGEITLTEARRRAKVLLDRVATGEDPKAVWDERRDEMTVNELFALTWEKYWDTPRFKESTWAAQVEWLYTKHLKNTFGKLKLSEVTVGTVKKWHSAYENASPYSANRALNVLSRMFRFSEEEELRPINSNPCLRVKAHTEKQRGRYATEEETKKIAERLDHYAPEYPHAVAFIYLLIFTGSRPLAIQKAQWTQLTEFELNGKEYGVLTFQGKTTSKTGEDEKVILPPQAMKVLKMLPRIPGKTIVGIKMPRFLWRIIRKEVGCEDLWIRDWRRTFSTTGLTEGVTIETIGGLLNHKSAETTKIYAKVVSEKKLEAVSAIADKLERVMAKDIPKVSDKEMT